MSGIFDFFGGIMDTITGGINNFFKGIEDYFGQFESFKDFLLENGRNPFFWVGVFIVGLIVYIFIYNALRGES